MSRCRSISRAVFCLALFGALTRSAAAQRATDLRSAATVPTRAAASDSARTAWLPRAAKGAAIGAAVAAIAGAALSWLAHDAFCGETQSCDDWPDRGFRESVLYGGMAGAALGFLLGMVTTPER